MRVNKILALADLHLTEHKPPCRLDEEDWIQTQADTMEFIAETAEKNHCEFVVIAGDIFDSWRTNSLEFLNLCYDWFHRINMNTPVVCIAGNHDSMGGNIDELKRSPYTLFSKSVFTDCSKISHLFAPYPYTMEGKCENNAEICVAHKGLYLGEKPFPNAPDSGNIVSFMNNMNENCRLLIAGDYHKPFICTANGCAVVNCGSVFRMRADQIDYKPKLWLCEWSNTRNEYLTKGIPIPLKYPIRRDYIDTKNSEEERLEELIGGISGDFEITANFKDNFKNMIKDLPNKELVYELFERCNK